MDQFIRITNDNVQWFLPLMGPSEQKLLAIDPDVYALGAVRDEVACGVLLFRHCTGYITILNYFVGDGYGGDGSIAGGLIKTLTDAAYETATPVICYFGAESKDSVLFKFFRSTGHFTIEEEIGGCYEIPFAMIEKTEVLRKDFKDKGNFACFFDLPSTRRNSFRNKLIENNEYYIEELAGDYIEEASLASYDKDGNITCLVLPERIPDSNDINLSFVWAKPGCELDLIEMIARSYKEIKKLADMADEGENVNVAAKTAEDERVLYVSAVNEQSENLVRKLLPTAQKTRQFYCASWDMERMS